jgi:hypothetical protein
VVKKLVHKVTKTVALNPVAQAVARKKLSKLILTFRLKVFLFDEEESCRDELMAIAMPVTALLMTMKYLRQEDSVDARKLKSGLGLIADISDRGFAWKRADAVTIDNTLEILERCWPKAPPKILNHFLNQLALVDPT